MYLLPDRKDVLKRSLLPPDIIYKRNCVYWYWNWAIIPDNQIYNYWYEEWPSGQLVSPEIVKSVSDLRTPSPKWRWQLHLLIFFGNHSSFDHLLSRRFRLFIAKTNDKKAKRWLKHRLDSNQGTDYIAIFLSLISGHKFKIWNNDLAKN